MRTIVSARSRRASLEASGAAASASWSARASRKAASASAILPVRRQEPAQSRPAGRQRGPRRRIGTRRAGQQRLRPPVGRQSLVRLAGRFEQPCDRDQAPADVDLGQGAGPRLGRQRLTRRQDRTMRRQGVLVAADLARQVGQLEVGLRQGPPRGDVGILAEQGAELAVEVRGRFQEPVAQLLEFLLLEQEVLTHAGVKRLDGLDGQVVAGLDLGVGGQKRGVLVRQGSVGPGLHGQHRRQTDHAGQHGRRRAGHPGAVPRQPAR